VSELIPDAEGCVTFEQAAEYLGMDIKRLKGIVWQQRGLTCPIGDVAKNKLYAFSVERYKQFLAAGEKDQK
jgi:hypothetical protein